MTSIRSPLTFVVRLLAALALVAGLLATVTMSSQAQVSGAYDIDVDCDYDPDADQTTCVFRGIAGPGVADVSHVDVPDTLVCADVIGGDYEYVDPDPNTGVIGYKSKGGHGVLTLVLEGLVVVDDDEAASYWIKSDGVFEVLGPDLDCDDVEGDVDDDIDDDFSEAYDVDIDCDYDPVLDQTTCVFRAFAGPGVADVSHLDIPDAEVCADVIGGDFEYVSPDPNTGVVGFKSKGGQGVLTLVLEGEVEVDDDDVATYWIKSDGVFAVPGPELECDDVDDVDDDVGCRFFEETGHAVCNEFLTFWLANGGLPVFGYPLTDAFYEENPDTGEIYLVQYFERQRFELHPENDGTPYIVLLGRLGDQILDLHGRDWQAFPAADPSQAHFVDATGHAIAPEFWAYWSSHGLELGDPGVSLRESVALFGYPISEPMLETNADGDTVMTQWFERAVFEWHPNNPVEWRVLLRRVGAEVVVSP